MVQVEAENYFNGRFVNKFKTGVLAGQVWEDPDTQDIIGYVLVTQDHNVTADYPTTGERVGRGIAQGFKLVAGVLAVAGPIIIGTLIPPAGILFAVLGAGAGIAVLAGQDEIASAFDLINPTSIVTCAARWAFSNTGQASGGGNYGAIGSTGWKLISLLRGKDVLAVSITSTTIAMGGAALRGGSRAVGHPECAAEGVPDRRGARRYRHDDRMPRREVAPRRIEHHGLIARQRNTT